MRIFTKVFAMVLLSVAVSVFSPVTAGEINVEAGDHAIANAVASASAGDVLVLVTDGGVYGDTTITIDKALTIKAADGLISSPIMAFLQGTADVTITLINLKANLTLEGLILENYDYQGTIIDMAAQSPNKVIIDNCVFRNTNRVTNSVSSGIEGETGTVDTMIVTNSLFYDVSRDAIVLRGITDAGQPAPTGVGRPGVHYLLVENCTFYSTHPDYKIAMNVAGYLPQAGDSTIVIVNHCSIDGERFGVYLSACSSASLVKNTSFTNLDTRTRFRIEDQKSVLVDYCNYWQCLGVYDEEVIVGNNVTELDPMFVDPSYATSGDFTLSDTSPLLGIADDGKAIGDLRWAPARPPAEISVEAGDYTLSTAVAAASAGDILILITDGGAYRDTTITIDKDLTIRAADGLSASPVVSFLEGTADTSYDLIHLKADLTLKNFILDNNNLLGNIIGAAAPIPNNIIIEGCELRNANRAMHSLNINAEGTDTGTVDTLIVKNSLFHDFEHNIINLRGIPQADVTGRPGIYYAHIENCTFYGGRIAVVLDGYGTPEGGDSTVAFINHITVDGGRHAILIEASSGKSVIKNSAFSNTERYAINAREQASGPYVDYCNVWTCGNNNQLTGCIIGSNLSSLDPEYADPANHDYTLSTTSPLLGKADDGKAIGDLRWEPTGTSVSANDGAKIKDFTLNQNYPNPFNPTTTVTFTLPKTAKIELAIYNLMGEQVAVLANRVYSPGTHSIQFDASDLSAGVYFCKLSTKNQVQVRKMTFIK